jgi:hypothetical protein
MAMTNRKELALILFFCLAAALRVFIFSAGFPFFSNIDEDLHFDVIMQYSHARLPRSFDLLKGETLEWIVPYASPEFLATPDHFPDAKFPPPLWKQSPAEAAPELAVTKAAWSTEVNFESSQPPLYYALASVWWRIGKRIGLTGIQSLYWIRFLNVPLIAIVVWLDYVTARTLAPERVDLRIGIFYAINNDVLSPICFGALFLCLLPWLRAKTPGFSLGALSGLGIAATYLTKLSNLPLVTVALVAIIAKLVSLMRQRPSAGLMASTALILCSAIPVVSWMMWTKYQFGDLTGSGTKITLLGWTRKPFADWWHHPIFTPRGLWTFWSDLLSAFWRGEVKWRGRPLSWQVADGFYAISSLILLGAAIVGLRKRAGLSAFQRQAIGIVILSFVTSVGFLALLSIRFDFGNCVNPSRGDPYFTSGRLLSGALIPFALLYVYGISSLLRRISAVLPLVVLGPVVVFVTTSEILVNRVVFASEHNWFHR